MYNGFEIDMLKLGNADCFLATRWENGTPTRVLIDGGNACDAPTVLGFLKERGITYLDHIVCSHPHDDHAAGLVEVVSSNSIRFGQAWMHLPWNHVDMSNLSTALNDSAASAKKVVKIINESVETASSLYDAFVTRGVQPNEPFQGQEIAFLMVCNPTEEFYESLLCDFTDYEKLAQFESDLASHDRAILFENIFEESTAGGLGGAPTEPENNSSTILGTVYDGAKYLFTSDSGVEALTMAKEAYDLSNVRWMQIPHHGSRRNVTEELIEYFKPKTAYVSASGTNKHPRRAVVNAFKNVGATVYSTHWPLPNGGSKWHHVGNVPDRRDYSATLPLYDTAAT